VLEQTSPFDYVAYQAFELPALFEDRDYVLRAVTTRDPDTGVVTQSIESVSHADAPPTVGVRAELVDSSYVVRPIEDDRVRVTVQILTDPRGSIPSWLANMVQRSWPLDTLQGIRSQLDEPWVEPHPLPPS